MQKSVNLYDITGFKKIKWDYYISLEIVITIMPVLILSLVVFSKIRMILCYYITI